MVHGKLGWKLEATGKPGRGWSSLELRCEHGYGEAQPVIYELGGGFHFDQRDRDCGDMVIDYRWLLGARSKAMELLGLLMHKRERSTRQLAFHMNVV